MGKYDSVKTMLAALGLATTMGACDTGGEMTGNPVPDQVPLQTGNPPDQPVTKTPRAEAHGEGVANTPRQPNADGHDHGVGNTPGTPEANAQAAPAELQEAVRALHEAAAAGELGQGIPAPTEVAPTPTSAAEAPQEVAQDGVAQPVPSDGIGEPIPAGEPVEAEVEALDESDVSPENANTLPPIP